MSKKEVIAFRKEIAPGEELTFSERIKGDGTIEKLDIRFYVGQKKELQVLPYVKHKPNISENLITFPNGMTKYLSGDDDKMSFDVVIPVREDDEIKVWCKNISDTTIEPGICDLVCDITIDYYAGTQRVIGGVING